MSTLPNLNGYRIGKERFTISKTGIYQPRRVSYRQKFRYFSGALDVSDWYPTAEEAQAAVIMYEHVGEPEERVEVQEMDGTWIIQQKEGNT